ncbi:MAG: hypothetical protein Q7U97_11705 [Rhodocyclaceae bacterium]|nr:hypothetical protein [Rhodocyclaceae bacterium]
MKLGNYVEARELINTGDLIAIRATHGGFPALTRWVTKSPYTHTAVALQLAGRLLIAEMNGGGACLVPLSRYSDSDFDVFACPVDRIEATMSMFDLLGLDIGYDFGDLVRIGGHELLGIALPPRDDDNLVCSALSASIYLHAGWKPAGLPSIPSPRNVVAAIGAAPIYEVRR